MLIRLGFDIQFEIPFPVAMIAVYRGRSSRRADLLEPDRPRITPPVPRDEYEEAFGNVCTRFVALAGNLQRYNSTLIENSGEHDVVNPRARQATFGCDFASPTKTGHGTGRDQRRDHHFLRYELVEKLYVVTEEVAAREKGCAL
jgi:hypothetical protein